MLARLYDSCVSEWGQAPFPRKRGLTPFSVAAEFHVGHLVLVILLGVAAEQQLHAGPQAVLIQPDLRMLRVEPDELQLRDRSCRLRTRQR